MARRFAAYIPITLTRQIADNGMPEPGQAHWLTAATLFSDLSGFTHMAEELAKDGPRGAEELNRTLLMTFTGLINAIHDAGGAVCHFHGDAMLVYFPDDDGRAASRALACGRFMQSLMLTSFTQVKTYRPSGKKATFDLSIRTGVGYGRCLEMVVGDPEISLEFVLAGAAVDEAVNAQMQARAGQLVASRQAIEQAGLAVNGPFREVNEVVPVPSAEPGLYWEAFDNKALNRLITAVPAFIPPTIHERLKDQGTQYVADHRPVTSMFVQFEGIDYEAEEAGQLLQRYYLWAVELVARFGGENSRVNRLLTGDKGSQLHILFGAPVAPDSPDQAIRCALALQREKPDFITSQRIGMAGGQMFACAVGSQNRREYTAVGSLVNLSSRLTQVCPDGGVVTDETTARRVRDSIEFTTTSPVEIKGKLEPIPLYLAQNERRIYNQLQAHFGRLKHPPIGRDEELACLFKRMDSALAGQGGLVALSGPFGSGQSRILAAAVRHWLSAGGTGWVGIGQPPMSDKPYGQWQSVWRDFFGLRSDMDVKTQNSIVVDQIRSLAPTFLTEASLWSEVLGIPMPLSTKLINLPAEVKQARLFAMVGACLTAAAEDHPLLIIIEDIHWADQLSLDLIDALAPQFENHPIMLIFTSLTLSGVTLQALNHPLCISIPLDDLPPERARRVVKHIVGVDTLPSRVEQRLGLRDWKGENCSVNPLFLEESLKMMLSKGVLQLEKVNGSNGHAMTISPVPVHVNDNLLAQMIVPDSISTLLLARLDRLPAASRSLLQVAAVIGREFDLETLVAIHPALTSEAIVDLLEELVRMEILQQVSDDPEQRYIFHQMLVHAVVYETIPYARRQTFHAMIADHLVAIYENGNLAPYYPVLAYHYSQTDRHENGLHYARTAAEDATDVFANREAVDLYKQALTHLEALGVAENWQKAVEILIARGKILRLLGRFTEGIMDATQALRLCQENGDRSLTPPINNLLAELKYCQGRYDEVYELAGDVVDELSAFASLEDRVQAYLLSAIAARESLEMNRALNHLQQAAEIINVMAEAHHWQAAVLGARSLISSRQLKLPAALKAMEKALELARTAGFPALTGLVLFQLSHLLLRMGRPETSLGRVTEAIELVRSTHHNLLAHALTQRAAVHLYLGQYPRALSDLKTAADLFEGMDDIRGEVELYLLWGKEYCPAIGDWGASSSLLQKADGLLASGAAGDKGHERLRVQLWLGLGRAALETKRLVQAETIAGRLLSAIEDDDHIWVRPAVYLFAGLFRLAAHPDDPSAVKGARVYFHDALDAVKNGGNPDYLAPIFLQLAQSAPSQQYRQKYLELSLKFAQERATFREKSHCFKTAVPILDQSTDERLRQLAGDCQAQIDLFDFSV